MNFKYAIFDMDGTLIDSMPLWRILEEELMEEFIGKEFVTQKVHDDLIFLSFGDMMEYAQNLTGRQCDKKQMIEEIHKRMAENYLNGKIPLKPFVTEYLQKLRQNSVKIAIATATPRSICYPLLERLGILQYVDYFTTCEEVGKSKKFPDIYINSMEKLGGNIQDTFVFEDALYCLHTLKANNFRTVAVYDEMQGHERQKIKEIADIFINDYSQII